MVAVSPCCRKEADGESQLAAGGEEKGPVAGGRI